jgi:hypothetical protein
MMGGRNVSAGYPNDEAARSNHDGELVASPEARCPREQKQPRANSDHADRSRGALARRGEAFEGDGCRDEDHSVAIVADESHRARLRVEMGRLRAALRGLADVSATKHGFALKPRAAAEVVVLARTVEGEHGEVLALLADGETWSSSGLALALRTSQRTVQRALDALEAAGKVQPAGRGRARRWITAPALQFTTTLLLPAPLPGD